MTGDRIVIEKENGNWPEWFGWWLVTKLGADFGEVVPTLAELAEDYGDSLFEAQRKAEGS